MTLSNTLPILGLAALTFSAPMLDDGKGGNGQNAATLIPKLGDKDYQSRKAAYRALEQMGAKARGELEKALKSDDPEVRWSASLLLDRLDESEADGALGRLRARADDELDDGARFDPLAPQPRMRRSIRMPEDAIEQMRDAMRELNFRFGTFGDHGGLELGPGSSFSRVRDHDGRRESVTVRVDEKGHVTAEQEKDGEKLTFEADSIEALKQEHPELLRHRSFELDPTRPADPNEIQPKLRRRALEKPADPAPAPAPTNHRARLGVQVTPVSAEVARWLELEEGLGLEVVRVVPGSAAEKLGIQARDIITAVNGREIRDAEGVAKALGDKAAADAEVTVLRRGAERTLEHAR